MFSNCRLFTFVAVILVLGSKARCGDAQVLQTPVDYFVLDRESVPAVVQALGRAHGFSVVCDPDVTGEVSVEMNNTTVGAVLNAVLAPGAYSYESNDGWIHVRRFQNRFYTFDYPQITRTGTASSTISLGGQTGQSQTNGLVLPGMPNAGQNYNGQNEVGGRQDATQIQIQQKSDADFWESVETQMRGMLGKEETLLLNRFSGVVQVRAGAKTQRELDEFVTLVNNRIGAQIEIVAKIVEVRLSKEQKLGIDWNVAAFSIGREVMVGAPVVPPGESAAIQGLVGVTNVLQAGEFQFSPDTFSGTIGSGKVDVVIRALQQQGDVKVTSQPRLRLLNNQTGYIKDATDRPFFRLVSNVTINAGGSTYGGAQPITQTQYQTQTISIGTVLPVTAQVSANDEVTLDLTPALTRLREIVTSPDKLQTAPVLEVKQTSTIVRLRSGESAIIGGLITDSEASTQRGVPGLSSIPGLGRLFRSDGKVNQRSELVIIITPTVIRNSGGERLNNQSASL